MYELMEKNFLEANANYELAMRKITMYTEAAYRQLNINRTASELKVIQEHGTTDDLVFLYEEAENGFVETVVKAIEKMRDSLLKFIQDMKDKILDMATDARSNKIIEEIEKKVKLFPLIGRKKVIVENYAGMAKCADDHINILQRLKAKLKSGQKVTTEEVNIVEKKFVEIHGKLMGVGSAMSVTVNSAIDTLKKHVGDAKRTMTDAAESVRDFCRDSIDLAKKDDVDPRSAQSIARTVTSIIHTKTADFVRFMSNLRSEIAKAIKTAAAKVTKESSDDMDMSADAAEQASDKAPVDNTDAGTDLPKEATTEGSDEDYPIPASEEEPDTDPWDDVMRDGGDLDGLDTDLDGDGTDDVPDDFGEGSGCSLESVFDDLMRDLAITEGAVDSTVNRRKKTTSSPEPAEPLTESAYDQLLGEIESLF